MNKSQLIVLWIGAAFFIFCLWNPTIVPNLRTDSTMIELTDEEWELELLEYNLSLADSKESLRKVEVEEVDSWEAASSDEKRYEYLKGQYIKMLLKGERPSRLVKKEYTYYTQLFNSNLTSLFTRLLSVIVITALVVYTLGDKNRVKVKEILQPLIRFEPKMENKPKDEQKQ